MVITIERTFISLFGGIGGFDEAFRRHGWKCVFYNDWDKYAVKTYNKNFGTNYEPSDVTKLDANTIPDHTLLCAGFPCQSFSLAGKRKGFEDSRGTMFFEICRIAKAKRTPLLLLENVKGLLSHDEGKTFFTILKCLDELGYDAEWQVLNSKHFSVPQNRERVFIIANLRGQPKPKVFPLCQDAGEVSEILAGEEEMISPAITTENAHGYGNNVTVGQTEAIAHCLDAGMHKGVNPKSFFEKGKRNLVYEFGRKETREHDLVPTLKNRMETGGNNVPMVMDYRKDEGFGERDDESPSLTSHGSSEGGIPVPFILSHSPRIGNPLKGGTGVLASDEHAFTLDSTPHLVNGLRRLTPKECERLQGFPDGWTEGVSDTQRYKQCGNSVTVNVIEAIAIRLNEVLCVEG